MALLCLCPWGEEGKNELKTEIDKLGIDGKVFGEFIFYVGGNYRDFILKIEQG